MKKRNWIPISLNIMGFMVQDSDTNEDICFEIERGDDALLIALAPKILESLKEMTQEYENVMHSEFDFPHNPWSAESRKDEPCMRAKKLLSELAELEL